MSQSTLNRYILGQRNDATYCSPPKRITGLRHRHRRQHKRKRQHHDQRGSPYEPVHFPHVCTISLPVLKIKNTRNGDAGKAGLAGPPERLLGLKRRRPPPPAFWGRWHIQLGEGGFCYPVIPFSAPCGGSASHPYRSGGYHAQRLRMLSSLSLSKKCRRFVSKATLMVSPLRAVLRGSTRATTLPSLPVVLR